MKNSVDDTGGPRAKRRPGSRFVCEVCCDQVHLTTCGSTIIMACPEHGAWIAREGEKLERIEFRQPPEPKTTKSALDDLSRLVGFDVTEDEDLD